MDDPNKKKIDGTTISLTQPHEVAYWTKKFGVSLSKLKEAVNAVGKSAKKVEEYLQKH